MYYSAITKTSNEDYPGKICGVVYTKGCNLNCAYCFSKETLGTQLISQDEVFSFLKSRIGKLDAICISGGEPTIYKDLYTFVIRLKMLGFMVKLDTNGTNPEVLEEVLPVLDYVAMDIKAPIHRYEEIVGCSVDTRKIEKSIKLISESGVDHEFRTTLVPGLTGEDIHEISKSVAGCRKFVIQLHREEAEPQSKESVFAIMEELRRNPECEYCARGL